MVTYIEYLPLELWIEIFSYLECHDLLRAFSNLNHYFDQLISCDHLQFYVHLGKNNRNPQEYAVQPYWPDRIINRIVSIRPISKHQFSHIPEFIRWHWMKLNHLKSLTMKVRGREICHLSNALQQLHSLNHLSIECVPNQTLLDAILATPALHSCRLELSRPITPITTTSIYISPVEFLNIKLHDDSSSSILHLLLSQMPKLKRLNMKNNDIYVKNREWIFFQPLFILPELRIIQLKCSSNYSSPVIFQSLHENFPFLQRLDLHIRFDFIDENLLNNIITHWWPLLQKLESLHISFECHKFILRAADHLPTDYDQFCSTLLAMNDQYEGLVKTEWTEQLSTVFKVIQISIDKSSS